MNNDKNVDYTQPVAYDTNGRPLYAHPPQQQDHGRQNKQHEVALKHAVHIARAAEPVHQELSEVTKKRHKKSVAQYPRLNLSEGEFVVSDVRRHPVGLYLPIGFAVFLICLLLAVLFSYPALFPTGRPPFATVLLLVSALSALIGLGAYIVSWVYLRNRLILTNESVIQETQHTLFAHHEQTVSLGNIEDVSYTRHGLLQVFLNYGSLRLSTEGEETTYRFHYVENPKQQAAKLHNAVEAFKNGRPIVGDD